MALLSHALLVVGLPGSGKTHFAQGLARQGWHMVDDITNVNQLPAAQPGLRVVITDPNFCAPEILAAARARCAQEYHTVHVVFFENNPVKCLTNVAHRADGRRVTDLIHRLSRIYQIPDDVQPLKIWQPGEIQH
jgi:predicted ATPase